jgi:hypothetical protein
MQKMIRFYLSDLKKWDACPDGYEWAEKTALARGRDYIVPEDFENVNWLAWCYARAARFLPDDRYTTCLLDAFRKMRKKQLYAIYFKYIPVVMK